jgi:hypothetical protein
MAAAAAVFLGARAPGSQPPAEQPAKPAEQPPTRAPSEQPPTAPAPGAVPTPAPQPPAPASTGNALPGPAGAEPATQSGAEPAAPPAEELREAEVFLRDGQRYKGFLVSQGEETIVLKIAGISTSIPTSRVQRVVVLAPVMERYRAMRAAVDDNDADALVRLAEWLRARNRFDLALSELDHVLAIQPGHVEAKRLRILVESQKKLADKSGVKKPGPRAAPPPSATGVAGATGPTAPSGPIGATGPQPRPGAFPLLSDRDINIIKVYEVDLADPPRLVIDHETIRRLIEGHTGDPLIPTAPEARDAIYHWAPARILDLMFRVQARELYEQVRVLDEPRSMRLFRDNVHRVWLVNACATSRCHGGAEAGRLALCNQRSSSDQSVYTNFLILHRFTLSDGKPLINYDEPALSPLLQMALPRENTARQHPVVTLTDGRGDLWRPFFKSPEDRRFQEAVQWIKSMYRPRPQYPIVYTPPSPQPLNPMATPEPSIQR